MKLHMVRDSKGHYTKRSHVEKKAKTSIYSKAFTDKMIDQNIRLLEERRELSMKLAWRSFTLIAVIILFIISLFV